jgi:hypothetical protein
MNELSSRLGQPEVAGKTPRERLALALSRSGVDASEALRDACQSVAVDSTVRPAQAPNLDAQIFLSAPKNQQAPDGAASTSEAASISSEEEASEEKTGGVGCYARPDAVAWNVASAEQRTLAAANAWALVLPQLAELVGLLEPRVRRRIR